ncbi:ferrochelatase [Chamaesiphon minutus]|uniref:Protoheme ferro-lyase (Ferrochelatase) n=1 Tax=Chamaesiphon minutus (strain ATCC 27169 / PCC 6605) TaxID=1173020 RepID=K9UC41_CHAP6|nr:ferrochelatase [Chamaesiphon minutus]AFY92390.1 protoheme ferro-lyase (ferrochelatase) [Chamaesiphon minutus PCC 6605]
MIGSQSQATHTVVPHKEDSAEPTRVAVLLAGYGEVESYRDLSSYNQAATKYIASQFVSIPEWLYPAAGWFLGLLDWYDFGFKHHHFMSPENEMFEKQRIGIEQQLQDRWGNRVQVFKGFYFCEPFVQEVVTETIEQGFENLLVFPLLVVDSAFTGKIAIEQVNEVIATNKSEDLPFRSIRYIPSFATEPTYIDLLVRQIKESLNQLSTCGCFESQIGVILTVHGGPEKANGLLTGVIDGQALFDRVQAQLQHQYPLISIGWINHDMPFIKWSQPNLEQAAKSLIGSGAQTIIFKPLGWVTENYETIIDVEDAIESLQRQYPTVTYTRLECVNDDPEFFSIAAGWANLQIEAMLSGSKIATRK